MGREYSSVVEALISGSACRFQLPFDVPALPIPGLALPSIPIPDLPSIPSIPLFCPLDDAPEPSPL